MTEIRELLDQLEQAHAAATPGPWRWDENFGDRGDTGLALTNDAKAEIVGAYNYHCCQFRDDPTVNDADAALIVAAVNALPQLVAAVRGVLDLADHIETEIAELAEVWASDVPEAIRAALSPAEVTR